MIQVAQKVRCAVCKKQVDRAVSYVDHDFCRVHFEFYCHGQVERAWLDQMEIEDNQVTIGEAFGQKLLIAPAPRLGS